MPNLALDPAKERPQPPESRQGGRVQQRRIEKIGDLERQLVFGQGDHPRKYLWNSSKALK